MIECLLSFTGGKGLHEYFVGGCFLEFFIQVSMSKDVVR